MADLLINVGAKDEASDKFRSIGKAASGLGTQMEAAGRKGGTAGEGTARSFLKAQVAFQLAAKGIQAFARFMGEGIKAVMEEEKAVDEMRKAYGMAAAGGKTLTSQVTELKDAQKELSKALADFIFKSEEGSKFIGKFTQGIKALSEFLSADERHARAATARQEKLNELRQKEFELRQQNGEEAKRRLADVQKEIAKYEAEKTASSKAMTVIVQNEKIKAEAVAKFGEATKKEREKRQREHEKEVEEAKRQAEEIEEIWASIPELEREIRNNIAEKEQEAHAKRLEDLQKHNEEEWKKYEESLKQRQQQIEQFAQTVSQSFGNYLEQGIAAIGKGEEFDIGGAIVGVLKTAVVGALSLLGPFGALLAPIAGGLIGGIGSLVTNAGRAHSGAWADNLPRFHSGGEVPAMLLPGERVLSHREIRNMGGPGQVDAAARGGGSGSTFVINALDARSFQQRVNEDIGTAIVRAAKTNKGEFSQSFRRLAGVY